MLSFPLNLSGAEKLKLCGVEWPPFTHSKNGEIVNGISFDVYTEAFRRLQMDFETIEIPWSRCLKYVEDGEYDAVIDNAALEPFLYGKFPTAIYPLAIYVRHDFPQETFSWDEMKGKTVGMVRGYDYTEKVKQFEGWKKELADTDEQMLRKLQKNRYDYVVLDIFAAPILAKQLGIELKKLNPLIDVTTLYLVFGKHKAEIAKQYDQVIGKMIQEGLLDTIYKKYLPYSYTDLMNMTFK
ncbi:MAG: ABC transporter substrate-binding protein [Beggiatoa sp. IS2]|nr:MAG: ABC transporter substrate-binding protein [Beggiatoa sp. IS2]